MQQWVVANVFVIIPFSAAIAAVYLTMLVSWTVGQSIKYRISKLQCIEYNAQNIMNRIQCIWNNENTSMHRIQVIQHNSYNAKHIIQCIEYNAKDTVHL